MKTANQEELTPLFRYDPEEHDHPLWFLTNSVQGDAGEAVHSMSLAFNCENSAAVVIPYPEGGRISSEWMDAALAISRGHGGTYVVPWRRDFSSPRLMLNAMHSALSVLYEIQWERHAQAQVTSYLLTKPDQGVVIHSPRQEHVVVNPWGNTRPEDCIQRKPSKGFK